MGKCLFCDSPSEINSGLCNICKYYRYTLPHRLRKEKTKNNSKKI